MICPNCFDNISDDVNFCTNCGKQIPRCPSCGKVLTKRVRFCTIDGTAIPDEINALLPDKQQSPISNLGDPVQINQAHKAEMMYSAVDEKEHHKTRRKKKRRSVILVVFIILVTVLAMALVIISSGLLIRDEKFHKDSQIFDKTNQTSTMSTTSPNTEENPHATEQTEPITEPTEIATELPTEVPTIPVTEAPTELPTEPIEETPLLYWIEYCDSVYLTEDTLNGFDSDTCRLARNAIFAKSGREFDDKTLVQYFEQFEWYSPTINPEHFTNNMLNKYQQHNLEVIIAFEESRGYR